MQDNRPVARLGAVLQVWETIRFLTSFEYGLA